MSTQEELYFVRHDQSDKLEMHEETFLNRDFLENICKPYFYELFMEFSQIEEDKRLYISKMEFSKAFKLPSILNERIFKIINQENKEKVSFDSFFDNIMILYSSNLSNRIQFIFNIFDFNSDGKISKDDLYVILSAVCNSHLQDKTSSNLNFLTYIDSYQNLEEQINKIIDFALKGGGEIDLHEFTKITTEISSDIFMSIYLSIKKAFPNLNKFKNFKDYRNVCQTPMKKQINIIASPKVFDKFASIQKLNAPITQEKNSKCSFKISNRLKMKMKNSASKENKFKAYLKKVIINQCNILSTPIKLLKNDNVIRMPNVKISGKDFICSPSIKLTSVNHNRIFCFCGNEVKDDSNKLCEICLNRRNDIVLEGEIYLINNEKDYHLFNFKFDKDCIFLSSNSENENKTIFLYNCFFEENKVLKIEGKTFFSFKLIGKNKSELFALHELEKYNKLVEMIKKALNYGNITDGYNILGTLCNTQFGQIMVGSYKKTNSKVAIKTFKKSSMNECDLEMVYREIEILKQCQHPNIIKILDYFESSSAIYIVMEYIENGDLFTYLEEKNFFISEKKAKQIIKSIVEAVRYLHSNGILHRDIKAENIFISKINEMGELEIKLADFGFSIVSGPHEKFEMRLGTLNYASPEIILGVPYGKEVDVWSIGILAHMLLVGFLPFDSTNDDQIMENIVIKEIDFNSPLWNLKSSSSQDFVKQCLIKVDKKRPSIESLLNHPWISDTNNKLISNKIDDFHFLDSLNIDNSFEIFDESNSKNSINLE